MDIFELLIESSFISSEYTLYLTYIIGLAAKLLIIWKITPAFYSPGNIGNEQNEYENLPEFCMDRAFICDSIQSWMAKLILKKGDQSDEPESLSPIL
ncbi:hypothetical protein [Bacillus sp. 7894-2]|uniref:hypothetical protein n=1 Tax=Bacillus sp. 7894-2 TaxID=2021695 RepID=UPI000BA7A1A9|nr:hypothetical protein [Bacillus sp. 7894-2]PAE26372.1 hypothetical protein CHI10_02930 [Bacillus sp. 7894-2]